jgi:RNA polymerase sigma-70 factor (ECF subfamily)
VAPAGPNPPPPAPRPPAPEAADLPRAGDGFARLERFWSEHSAAIFRAAYRITGNLADAEDVLQTVFLRLARRGEDEVDERGAGGYLHRSAVNAALDIMRSRQRSGWVPLESPSIAGRGAGVSAAVAAAEIHASAVSDPERDQRNRELRANLRLAVTRLGPRAAEIFVLRYIEGMPNREIAALLGVSQGLVAVLLHRTRARLRKDLAVLHRGAR